MAAKTARIPVYLLTGYLGSGKTTLLASWLKESELAKTALIVNEAGEVGFDQHFLRGAVESVALLTDACVCCTGLPGLEQALTDLFWSRLHRRIGAFDAVFIEATGLAEPPPIVQLMQEDALLRERYRLAGVIATLSAAGGLAAAGHPEAMSQIGAADLVIVTKADLASLADTDALLAAVAKLNPRAALATSANANLCAGSMLSLLSAGAGVRTGLLPLAAVKSPEHSRKQVHAHSHTHHDAQALFLALPASLARADLATRLACWINEHKVGLLRLKGLVRLDDGDRVAVQWSIGDLTATLTPVDRLIDPPQEARYGLTVILEKACYRESRAKLFQAFGCPDPTVTTA